VSSAPSASQATAQSKPRPGGSSVTQLTSPPASVRATGGTSATPRCGRGDWLVNGLLFGLYHLHEPWVIPNAIVTGWLCAYPARRFRSSVMGIAVHSVEAVFFLAVLLPLVMSHR
jgi:hypothetical protein